MRGTTLFFTLLIIAPVFTSCGNNDDDDSGTRVEREEDGNEKNLFSRWTSDNGFVLDLRGGDFDRAFDFNFFFQDGAVCNCSMNIAGTQTSGEIDLSSCFYTGGGNGDPGCSQLDDGGAGSYTKSSSTLRLCTPDCANLR